MLVLGEIRCSNTRRRVSTIEITKCLKLNLEGGSRSYNRLNKSGLYAPCKPSVNKKRCISLTQYIRSQDQHLDYWYSGRLPLHPDNIRRSNCHCQSRDMQCNADYCTMLATHTLDQDLNNPSIGRCPIPSRKYVNS